MSLRSRLLSCLLAPIALSACANDFDALFKNGGADASTGADGGTRDGGGDAAINDCKGSSCTCSRGATCSGSCDNDGTCAATAGDANLTYACTEHVDACMVTCNGTLRCDVRCDAEGTCSMKCGEKATCTLRCTNRPKSCSLDCDEGQKKDCGDGVFTCSASCP